MFGRAMRIGRLAAAVLWTVAAGSGCQERPTPPTPPAPPATGGPAAGVPATASDVDPGDDPHARMVATLAEISRQAADENPFMGDVKLRRLRAALAETSPDADPLARLRLHYETGLAELQLGNTRKAIEELEIANGIRNDLGDRLTVVQRNLTVFQLGVAYLRHAERQNCVGSPTLATCLLPIRDDGRYQRTEGSEGAIRCFEEALATSKPTGWLHLTARWLLNIAYMSLGRWPDDVPPEYVIPASAFESEIPFPRFRDVVLDVGLEAFSMAGGVCIEDFDGDDDLDVLVSTWDTSGPIRYFRSEGDGRFTERSDEAGLTGLLSGLNMVHADYDNDGDADVYVLRGGWLGGLGRHPNSLLRNDGGRFTDVTFASGFGDVYYPTQTASWGDYDGDGDLDLYVGNESSHEFDEEQLRANGYEAVSVLRAPSQLFRNEGDGTFTERAAEAGVTNDRYAKGVIWGDYDGDDRPDLYVSNYAAENRLYHNEGDGTFRDVAPELGVTQPIASFPTWFFDYDNDGNLDLFVASYSAGMAALAAHHLGLPSRYEPSMLAHGDGHGGFTNVTESAGLLYPMLAMGANFGDLDGDGYLDMYLGTGSPSYSNLMPNVLYVNRSGRRFANVSTVAGFSNLQKGHGVAFADLDHDGDVDLFQQVGGAYPGDAFRNTLYENPGFGHHTLTVQLVGVRSNRSAIGARLHARFREGGRSRDVYRTVNTGGSFGSSPLRQYLGLGTATKVDTLEIHWPATGETQVLRDIAADQAIRIVEGEDAYTPLSVRPFALTGRP